MVSKNLRRYHDLLWLLIAKEITLKYKRTYLGVFWSLLNPLLLGMVYYLAFKVFMRIQIDNYTLFLLSAMFPWTWFSATATFSAGTLVGNVDLIRKVRFPRHMLVVSLLCAQLVNFLFSIPVILGLVCLKHSIPGVNWLIGIPILIVIQSSLTLGVSLIISIVNAYFRDMEYLVGVLINVLFWLTPVVYPLTAVPERFRHYMNLNPLVPLMSSWRELFMNNALSWKVIGNSFAISLVVLFLGILVFHRLGKRLDEFL